MGQVRKYIEIYNQMLINNFWKMIIIIIKNNSIYIYHELRRYQRLVLGRFLSYWK